VSPTSGRCQLSFATRFASTASTSTRALSARVDPADTRLQPHVRAPNAAGSRPKRPEELLALREQDIDRTRANPRASASRAHRRSTRQAGRAEAGVEGAPAPRARGTRRARTMALFPRVLHPGRAGRAIAKLSEHNVVQFVRSEFLYVTGRTGGSCDEQLGVAAICSRCRLGLSMSVDFACSFVLWTWCLRTLRAPGRRLP
jgi:hypothetical protein